MYTPVTNTRYAKKNGKYALERRQNPKIRKIGTTMYEVSPKQF
jgi:hypothetical protein